MMKPSPRQATSTEAHAEVPLEMAGPSPEQADASLVFVHGRGATAASILSLYRALQLPTLAALAPQAAKQTWYPHSFLAPLESNQPFLDSAIKRLESIVGDLLVRGIPSRQIAVLGFSQGACLTLEFVARHPRPLGAVMGLTGGLKLQGLGARAATDPPPQDRSRLARDPGWVPVEVPFRRRVSERQPPTSRMCCRTTGRSKQHRSNVHGAGS